MEKEKIMEAISGEEQKLISLQERRLKLDVKIKEKQVLINKHKALLTQKKFCEAQMFYLQRA